MFRKLRERDYHFVHGPYDEDDTSALSEEALWGKVEEIMDWMGTHGGASLASYTFVYPDGSAIYSGRHVCFGTLEHYWLLRRNHRKGPNEPAYFINQGARGALLRTSQPSDENYLSWVYNHSMFKDMYLGKKEDVRETAIRGQAYDMRKNTAQEIIVAEGSVRMVKQYPRHGKTWSYLTEMFTPEACYLLSMFMERGENGWALRHKASHGAFYVHLLTQVGCRRVLDQTFTTSGVKKEPFSTSPDYHDRHKLFNGRSEAGVVVYTDLPKVPYTKKGGGYYGSWTIVSDKHIKKHCLAFLRTNVGETYAENHTL